MEISLRFFYTVADHIKIYRLYTVVDNMIGISYLVAPGKEAVTHEFWEEKFFDCLIPLMYVAGG
jgi:hypothetical protein